jgi:glutathione S-transferase
MATVYRPMLTVHHLNNSRSQRVLWLLEELGVPYEVKRYERDPKTMLAPPELRAVHPLGPSGWRMTRSGGFPTWPDGNVRRHLYEDLRFGGALTGLIDESGTRVSTWTYDSKGRATGVSHPDASRNVQSRCGGF